MAWAISFWQPMASIDTKAPSNSNILSSLGIAVISLDLSSTATCPKVREFAPTQALTKWRHAPFRPRLPRSALPSIWTCLTPKWAHRALIQEVKQSWKTLGARWQKMSRKVSWEGMPWGRVNPRERSQTSLVRPKAARSSKLLAPDSRAHKAMVRMSPNTWVMKRRSRGSATAAKWWRMSRRGGALIGLPLGLGAYSREDREGAMQGQPEKWLAAGETTFPKNTLTYAQIRALFCLRKPWVVHGPIAKKRSC